MIDNANKDEIIEQYLLGEISGVLLEEFKEKLATDDQFRKEVAIQKAMIRNIKIVGRKEWALKLEDIHHEMKLRNSGDEQVLPGSAIVTPLKSFYKKKYLLGAAAAILVIIFSALFLKLNNGPNTDRIFISYYKPYPSLEQSTRALPTRPVSEKDEAIGAYKEGNYGESIRLFKSILAKGEDEEVLFYLGNAFLSASNPGEAEVTFKKYLTSYKEFAVESKWYLSLSYLKQKKVKEGKELLEELAKENNDYSKKAREVLARW